MTCDTPVHTAETVDVTVKSWGGEVTVTDGFTYLAPINSAVCKNADPTSGCQMDIDANMIPIKYTGNTTTPQWQKADTTTPGDWYDYQNQKWANAVTVTTATLNTYKNAPTGTVIPEADILGYWVYIPRYAYEVQRYNAWNKPVCGNNQSGTSYADANCTSSMYQARFDIKFEKATDTKKTPSQGTCTTAPASAVATDQYTGGTNYRTGCGVSRTYGAATGTTWFTHPAFTSAQSTSGTELNGIWVAKYETTGSTTAPTVKPGLKSQISQVIGVQYDIAKSIGVLDSSATGGNGTTVTQNSHNLASAKSHDMKNSEWGAVAYLADSIYGSNGKKVQINAAYSSTLQNGNGATGYGITGCGPSADGTESQYTITDSATTGAVACTYNSSAHTYQTTTGQLASTTQNVYGVYDMAGGAYEYVMGNFNNIAGSTSYMATMSPANFMNVYLASSGFSSKPTWSSSSTNYYYNFDVCTLATCGGQANYETTAVQSVSSNNQSWGTGYSHFVDSSHPWFLRGGYSGNGSTAGLFSSYRSFGNANASYSFRVVLGV
jgi:hypothetical protein